MGNRNHYIPPKPPTTAERVEFIRQLLVSGEWDHLTSRTRIAAAWKLSRDSIHKYRKEAGQIADYTARPPNKGLRIQFIENLMADFLWQGNKSIRELAKAWRLKEHAIQLYAGEARRRLEIDPSEVRQKLIATGNELLDHAREIKSAKDFKFVGDILLRASGIENAHVHHHVVDVNHRTPAMARQMVSELFGGKVTTPSLPEGAPKLEIKDAEFEPAESHTSE